MFFLRGSASGNILKSTRITAFAPALREFSASITDVNDSHATSSQKPQIPNRIHRSPTAILEALAATVGDDPTAAHYKYHDDPYLIPMSNSSKKTFAMAHESGRKAAKWIKEEHRSLFLHSVAQPPIERFSPKMLFTEESEIDDHCLKTLIHNSEVTDAVFVYNLMKTKDIPISNELKQAMLEFVCFYNNQEPLPEDFIEEKWFQQESTGGERNRKTWKDGDVAELIFNDIEPKTAESYSAIIRGMCKYYQVERAWALFQEATEKQFELDTKTFNALLSIASLLKDTADLKWELCKDLLNQMQSRQLKPDRETLHGCLTTISSIGNFRLARSATLKVLSEFKKLNIEPTLGTWYYVLAIFCRERGPVSHVIVDILNEIQGKEFSITDEKDTYFFVTAMDICRNHLHDISLAKRVDALLHVGNNYDLIGDSNKESVYYRHYFALLCQTEPLDVFFKTYDLLVPNVYIPEPGIMYEILKTINTNGALELVPRIWSDMIIFDQSSRENLLESLLKTMSENKPSADIESHEGLTEKFGNIAFEIFTKVEEQSENRLKKCNFTGQMLGNILKLTSMAMHWENSKKVFDKLENNQHQISGTPSSESMVAFVDICIAEKSPSRAISCLEYCAENGFDAITIARKIAKEFTLNEVHLNKVKNIVGEDFLDVM